MRRTLRTILAIGAIGLAVTGVCQVNTVVLKVPKANLYTYFIASTVGEFVEPRPIRAANLATDIALPDDINGKRLYVVETTKGLTAGKDLVAIAKEGSWAPTAKEFDQWMRVVVTTKTGGGRLPVGSVTLTGPLYSDTQLITEKSGGRAEFWLVPTALESAKLIYEADGTTKEVTLPNPVPVKGEIEMVVADVFAQPPGAESPKPESTASSKEGDAKAPAAGGGVVATIVRMLLGVGIVAGLAYAGWWYYKNNQTAVETVMAKAGINPGAPADPTGALPVEPENRPMQKIDLGTEASQLGSVAVGGGSGIPASVSGAPANPRLVTGTGDVFMVPDGESTCGREGAALTVPETSVSRQHAVLSRTGGSVSVRDAGSTNGTFVNGVRLTGPVDLRPGDTVQFGSVQYRYEE